MCIKKLILYKIVSLAEIPASVTAKRCTRAFIATIFRLHGLPANSYGPRPLLHGIVLGSLFGTRLTMSLLTIQRQMVRRNSSTASSKNYLRIIPLVL